MSKSKYKRKLIAILSADVVGYSRLMGDDEESTIQTLNAYRDIMATLIEDHSGSVVDAVGDNLLAEFTSAVDAVQCAAAIQIKLKEQNDKLSASRHMLFRIGINIGDVVHEKDKIYGDGVNIAARIESLADPGGVYISRNIYNHIKKKLDFGYEYIGEHKVKNISDPVRVYNVLMDLKDAGKRIKEESDPPVRKSRLKKWLKVMAFIILILFAVLAGVYWKYIYLPAPDDIDPDGKMEFNLPEGPSIAVLPFVNMSNDPELEYFCDGITENIILNLARSKAVLVIARNSTFAYKNKSINAQKIGQELNVEYMIEGSIQKTDDLIRISVQLIDTDSGVHIWSDSYDRKFKDIFKLQDEITLETLHAVGIKLISPWIDENGTKAFTDVKSFINYVKLMEFLRNPKKEGYASALKITQGLIDINPEHPHRYDMLALVYIYGALYGYSESGMISLFKATEAVKKSLSLAKDNSLAHQAMGWIFAVRKEHDNAIASFKKSIEIDSMNAEAYWSLGSVLNFINKPKQALESLKIAFRINPIPPVFLLNDLAHSYLLLEEYEKSIKILKKSLERQPDYWMTYLTLTLAYGYSDQKENAETMAIQLLNLIPDYSIEKYKKTTLNKNPVRIERNINVLRKAGVPEQ